MADEDQSTDRLQPRRLESQGLQSQKLQSGRQAARTSRVEAEARLALRHVKTKRPYRSAPSVAAHIRPLVKDARKGAGLTLPILQARWSAIVGEKLAALCWPEKLSRSKAGRTLTLAAYGPAATHIGHDSSLLLQRINLAVGGAGVERIAIVQRPPPRATPPKRPKRLSAEAKAAIVEKLQAIDNPRLRSAVERLGQALLSE